MLELVARVGPSSASVLLLGESGTGKELVARAVHEASPRAAAPLVVVDCASLPEDAVRERAVRPRARRVHRRHADKAGLVEAASGGTLFLDEVGDIPLAMQVKLLRLLESGTYRRVGSTELRRTDVRVVAATHRDLLAMVAEVVSARTCSTGCPPSRSICRRCASAPTTSRCWPTALLARVAPERRLTLSRDALARLVEHAFPGNVRELRNVLERAALLTDGGTIGREQIDRALAVARPLRPAAAPTAQPAPADDGSSSQPGHELLREAERAAIRAAAASHKGSRAELARHLGISERSLYRKLRTIDGGD